MKLALSILLTSLALMAKPVEGVLTYKLPSGDLVDREVILEVPARGQGEVVLSGKSFEWKTTNFRSFKSLGRDVFVASFDTEFRGMKSTLIFKGTYLKGNNKLSYTGDIYKLKKSQRKLDHIGIFNFQYQR
jgi:hypothetical protein